MLDVTPVPLRLQVLALVRAEYATANIIFCYGKQQIQNVKKTDHNRNLCGSLELPKQVYIDQVTC